MILSALIHNDFHHVERWEDIAALIDEAVDHADPGSEPNGLPAGEIAQFQFAAKPWTDEIMDWAPDNFLQLSSNPAAGYAALVWAGRSDSDETDQLEMWVTFNPASELSESVRLTIDPGVPRDHDPRSAVPLEQAREAVRQFCRTEGQRPTGVQWVRGDLTGKIESPS